MYGGPGGVPSIGVGAGAIGGVAARVGRLDRLDDGGAGGATPAGAAAPAGGTITTRSAQGSTGDFLRSAAGIRVPRDTQKLREFSAWIHESGMGDHGRPGDMSGASLSKITSRGRLQPCEN